ncbi:MAG: site-2 protease family protein [Pirellulales bacterium]|nr:site-2 protease family protein [Pirellulales bacterium]
MHFDETRLIERLTIMVPLWLSLSVHEWAHAWSAWRLGDDTAALMGRLTLNPLAHIDPIGTVLLPLMGVPFGWAKPVPVQPLRFRRDIKMQTGMMITAAAGPISNLVLAAGSIVLFALLVRFFHAHIDKAAFQTVSSLLGMMIFLNVALAVFNLLPIPPLDGSRVADALMPRGARPLWEDFCRFGPLALAAVIILPLVSGINLFYWPMAATSYVIQQALALLGGLG